MGLLDTLASQVLGSLSGANTEHQAGLMDAVSGMLNDPQVGGVSGLVSAFEQQGLGGIIGSWIGTGKNLPISPEQLQSVLGDERIQAIAKGMGLSTQDVSSHLSQLMPTLIDKMTPDGQAPAAGEVGGLLQAIKGALG